MKTLKLIALGLVLFISGSIHSQVSVSVNIGTPPAWGPVGYANVGYYYLPDIEAYYDVNSSLFIYFGNGRWIRSRNLPYRYRNYDLYDGYKVVLNDYHGRTPYVYFKNHKAKYYRGYKGKPQRTIGVRHDNRDYDKHDNRNYNKGDNGNNKHGNGKH